MEIPQETEDFFRETIDYTVGLPVSTGILLQRLRAIEDARDVLRRQNLCLRSKLKEKDGITERSKAEASMNAVALKKFVEENQKLAAECSHLLVSCQNWERECALYDKDREAILDFANEADERAREAEVRIGELENEKKNLEDELQLYKVRSDGHRVDTSTEEDFQQELILLDLLLTTVFGKDEIPLNAHKFLEAHCGVEACQEFLAKWPSLRPLTQKVIALTAGVENLQKDEDRLTKNLRRSEQEVNALFQENNMLNEENKRLIRKCYRDKHAGGPGGGSGSSSGKGKRKSSCNTSSPIDLCSDADSQRQPLSPLQCNSLESRMRK